MKPERKTRNERINKILVDVGWTIIKSGKSIPSKGNFAVEEYPTKSGPADYALIINNNIMGVIEAKKENEPVYEFLTQAKRYARDIESKNKLGDYNIPFIYSTNGSETYFEDLRKQNSRSRKLSSFHSPNALLEYLSQEISGSSIWLVDNLLEDSYIYNKELNPYSLCYYQREAVEAIENTLKKNKQKMFVGMATGTGKTVTILVLLYRMLKSKRFKRILFLVDRVELTNPALAALSSFEPELGQKFDKIYEIFANRIPQGKEWESLSISTKKLPELLYYFINNYYEFFNKQIQGTGIPHLKKEYISNLEIPPSLLNPSSSQS